MGANGQRDKRRFVSYMEFDTQFRELSSSVKSEGLSLSVVFKEVTFSVGFVAVVDLSLGLVFGVNSTPRSSLYHFSPRGDVGSYFLFSPESRRGCDTVGQPLPCSCRLGGFSRFDSDYC